MTDQSTTERIAELKKLAEAASPGPWEYRMLSKDIPAPRIDSASGKVVMKTWNVLYSNCEFIAAANPQAILKLIEHIAELERQLASMAQGVKHGFDCLCHPSHWLPLPAAPSTAQKDGGNNADQA